MQPDLIESDLAAGERLLLCTDGLYETIADEAIARVLRAHPAIRDGVVALLDAALLADVRDNLTIILIEPGQSGVVV
jgi:PPM family protein phosphatase